MNTNDVIKLAGAAVQAATVIVQRNDGTTQSVAIPASAIPASPGGISPTAAPSWLSLYIVRAAGAAVTLLGLAPFAVPVDIMSYLVDPQPVADAVTTLFGLGLTLAGHIGLKGRENGGRAPSPIVR